MPIPYSFGGRPFGGFAFHMRNLEVVIPTVYDLGSMYNSEFLNAYPFNCTIPAKQANDPDLYNGDTALNYPFLLSRGF